MKYNINFDLDFQRNPHSGLYIVFEGVNASGKSTQVEQIKSHFEKVGKKVIVTSEPNDDLVIGQLIREILLGKVHVPSSALQYLYTADRIVNHETVVIPALKAGKVVLSSRSFWSAIVYGILDKGGNDYTRPDADLLLVAQGILSMYHQFMLPNYTFYLDVSLETVLERMAHMDKEKDIYEKREKLSQLINGYQWVAKEFKDEFVVLNGEKPVGEVTNEILKRISESGITK